MLRDKGRFLLFYPVGVLHKLTLIAHQINNHETLKSNTVL